MKTRNGLFADVPENLWNDWHWQVANRAETVEDLKKYMTLTPEEAVQFIKKGTDTGNLPIILEK